MRILVHGNGVAATLFAYLAAGGKAPHDVTLAQASSALPGDPGIVFDDAQLTRFARYAPDVVGELAEQWRRWDEIEVRRGANRTHIAIGKRHAVPEHALVAALRRPAQWSGCRILSPEAPPPAAQEFDLVVVADGKATAHGEFEFSLSHGRNRLLYAEADLPLDHPIFSLRSSGGNFFQASFQPIFHNKCRILIETAPIAATARTAATLGDIFAEDLAGRGLRSAGDWQAIVGCEALRRVAGRIVLLGRSAAVTHPMLGLDGRAEIEDAIALFDCLRDIAETAAALAAYETTRIRAAESAQRASDVTRFWGETLPHYRAQDDVQFAFNFLTRHYRIDWETIGKRDSGFIGKVTAGFAARAGADPATPPMFCPFRLRGLELPNRIVFSPMAMRQGTPEATPTDFHLVHLGGRAMGGAGLVFGEMTSVSPEGRISLNCVGIYRTEHVVEWRRIVDFIHAQSTAKIGLQLGHAGRKGGTRRAPDGRNVPLDEGSWELLSASAIPWSAKAAVPKQIDRKDMDKVVADYTNGAKHGVACGFDILELHMAHGYLLSSFISPVTNRREDEYGGSLVNRMRFPLEVLRAVREVWPPEKPITVRISAYDWLPDGLDLDEAVEVARRLKDEGCDMLTVSSGHTTSGVGAGPDHGRLYQTPFSDRIRNEIGIPTMAVGTIFSWGDVNSVLAAGRGDLCALGRGHLFDPYFTRHAAYAQGYEMKWPPSYRTAALFKSRGFV